MATTPYFVDWIKPSQRGWTSHRLVNEEEGAVVSQVTDNAQERIITVFCAAHTDVANLIQTLQDGGVWINIQNNTAPVHAAIDLFQGNISALRYLLTGEFDSGSYTPNAQI